MEMVGAIKEQQLLKHKMTCKSVGESPLTLADIYQNETHIAIWQRDLSASLSMACQSLLQTKKTLEISTSVRKGEVCTALHNRLGSNEIAMILSEDIEQLVEMVCCLFASKQVGLRLTALQEAMCPRFHVDRIPCRLVTTYYGGGTQWLPPHVVDRSKLGNGNQGKTDAQSGLFSCADDIQQLGQGDVALLKGDHWQDNEGAGLIHRSPELHSYPRLLLTLDPM